MSVSEFDGSYDVVLLPTFSQVENWRKHAARQGVGGMFSQVATTFNAWMADLWELHGDGRAIVDSLQRRVIMQVAFERAAAHELVASAGVVKLAARCVRQASGLPEFEHVVDQVRNGARVDALTEREAAFLSGISCYQDLLDEAGLVEMGSVAAFLAGISHRVFSRPSRVLVAEAAPLDWIAGHFLESCEQLQVDVIEAAGASGIERVPDGVDVQFAFPSGRYAQPGLVVDLVRNACERAGCAQRRRVVVACKDPIDMYKQAEAVLADMGAQVCVQAQVKFSSTDFGRQFLSLAYVLDDEEWSIDQLSDAIAPPFAKLDMAEVLTIDKRLRADRLVRRDVCLAELCMSSDMFAHFEELASDPEADVLLGAFEQIAFTEPGRSAAWKVEQLTAAAALRSCTSAARRVGASMKACVQALEDTMVTVSYEAKTDSSSSGASAEGGAADSVPHGLQACVVFTTQAAAARMGAGSCDQLILCDLTSEAYPIADKDDAATILLAKIGLLPTDSALARARRMFAALQGLACEQVVGMRPLNDVNGAETYPSAVLQEFVDAYREDASLLEDVDEVYGLPSVLRGTLVQRGEELLYANAVCQLATIEQPRSCEVDEPERGYMSDGQRELVALSRRGSDGRVVLGFSPSPSQVEAYLECPYKWYAQSRIKVEGLDEGFGPLERGSYSHAVLQEFYRRFNEMGQLKVNSRNLEQARSLMREVADEVADVQYQLEAGSGRYVATNQIESREIQACKDQLVAYLDFESQFLPGFHPAYLERSFGPEDDARYAGRPFVGTVDRIDVDEAGNAVVIDYKGSLSDANTIAGKTADSPGKVQTRMYAQVVGRELGLNVVGALYVSYGARHGCSGAFDGRALESPHLPFMRHDKCCCAPSTAIDSREIGDFAQMSFTDMLDQTEQVVAAAIDAMEAGVVDPDPVSADVCTYCPVAHCPKRGA